MNKYKIYFLLLAVFCSCSEKTNKDASSTEYYDVPVLESKITNRKVVDLLIDEVLVDSNLNSSFVGDLWVNNDNLYFSDNHFGYVFQLDLNGNLLNTFLGKGEGPSEITDLDDVVSNDNKGFTVLSSHTTEIYNFDNSWNRINKNVIDFDMKRNYDEVLKKPEPSLP